MSPIHSAGAVSRVSDVLNALPDLLHDIVTLRSECERLRRVASRAQRDIVGGDESVG